MNDEKDFITYHTSDLYFSAYLCAIDLPLETTEKDKNDPSNKKVVFIFKIPRKDAERLKAAFFGGTATVKAQKFVNAIKSLKSICYT
jgi:hypothetical protein